MCSIQVLNRASVTTENQNPYKHDDDDIANSLEASLGPNATNLTVENQNLQLTLRTHFNKVGASCVQQLNLWTNEFHFAYS